MSSEIGIYGKTKRDRQWMKENFPDANRKFKKRHPAYDPEYDNIKHGILENENTKNKGAFRYYWVIPCHKTGLYDPHFHKTEMQVRDILYKLHAPRNIMEKGVSLSPMCD
jgi:hypothetical protein